MAIETWERMGFDKDDLIDSRIRLSAANKRALRVLGRTPIKALNLGEGTPIITLKLGDELSCGGEPRRV